MTGANLKNSLDDDEQAVRVRAWLAHTADKRAALKLEDYKEIRKRFAFRCLLLFLTTVALLLDFYRHGISLETTGPFSSTTLLTFALPVLLWRASASGIGLLKNPVGRKPKSLMILLLLPAAIAIPFNPQVPRFTDGVARTLRNLNISNELVAATAEVIATPGASNEGWVARSEQLQPILKKYPFSKLQVTSPHLSTHDSSLLFEFGSPIANRWGFSISGAKGQSPTVPPNASDIKFVSKEIVVFSGPPD